MDGSTGKVGTHPPIFFWFFSLLGFFTSLLFLLAFFFLSMWGGDGVSLSCWMSHAPHSPSRARARCPRCRWVQMQV